MDLDYQFKYKILFVDRAFHNKNLHYKINFEKNNLNINNTRWRLWINNHKILHGFKLDKGKDKNKR